MVMSLQYTFLSALKGSNSSKNVQFLKQFGNVQTFYCDSRLYHKNKVDTCIHVMHNSTKYRPNNML